MAKAGNSILFWALDMSTQQSRAPAFWALFFHKPFCLVSDPALGYYTSLWISGNSFQDSEGNRTVILENVCWHIITLQMKNSFIEHYSS